VFDENVVEALSSWVYEPAEYENSPVRISVIKVFKFN
jgi:outer membrane biosynthesis protein TonB